MTTDETADDRWSLLRREMVEGQLRARGIQNRRVLDAMSTIPRHRFLPPARQREAYEDRALPIRFGQTISQPYIVGYMSERLDPAPSHKVLEIGTGTGYQTAVLARLAVHIYTVERIEALQAQAAEILSQLNVTNVTFVTGDGSLGLPDQAPFDRILVTAGAPGVPRALMSQLADGGRMILPVGGAHEQSIVCVERKGARTIETSSLACRFVRLIGAQGWTAVTE